MKFRTARESDVDQIMKIIADGRASLAALGIDQWQRGYPYREVIEDDVERGESFVVVVDDHVVATAMIGFFGEVNYDRIEEGAWLTQSHADAPRYGVIHRVAVDAQWLGFGVASYLFDRAENRARQRGCESLRIDTHSGNYPMQKLLEKVGFVRCGIIFITHSEGGTPQREAYEKLLKPVDTCL